MVKLPDFPLAAQSAAGEGSPLPTKDDGVDRRAICAINLWWECPAPYVFVLLQESFAPPTVRGAFTTGYLERHVVDVVARVHPAGSPGVRLFPFPA